MKSKVRSIANYIEIPFEHVTETVTEEELGSEVSNDIEKELLAHRSYVKTDTAAEGDVAELRLESGCSRYRKDNISLNLGLGLFSMELENSVIGRKTGDTYAVEIDGTDVKVTVLSLSRKIRAELSDEFVRSLGIEGVKTVTEYREHLKDKYISLYRGSYLEYHAMDLFEEMMERSDIEYCDEDIAPFVGQFMTEDATPEDEEIAGDDAWFILRLYLADCIARGIDYRLDEELPIGNKRMNDLRDRVIAPIMRYLDDKIELVIEGDEA